MKPNVTLAEIKTPNGARLTLVEHDGSYCIRVNGQQLMHSAVAASEIRLGQLGCARHTPAGAAPRVLIGGLGLGFTLQSVLHHVGPKAIVHVAELFPEIVMWNRTHLAALNGRALADARVTVFTEDVTRVLQRAAGAPYDVIVLDIDNGTTAMVKDENHGLYREAGLRLIARALKSGGRAAIWSASIDPAIAKRLTQTGFVVQATKAKLHERAKSANYMIYLADKPATLATTPQRRLVPKRPQQRIRRNMG
jgi:spermidine synthase